MAKNGSNGIAGKSRRGPKVALSLKFAVFTMAVVMLLLGIAVALSLWSSYREAERAALSIQHEKAQTLASRVDGYMSNLSDQLAWTAQPDWKRIGPDQQRADFARMLRQFPAITELFYIDSTGTEQLKVSRLAPDSLGSRISHASEPRFRETVKERNWFGPVYVRNGSDMAGSMGVAHTDGGVTVAELDLGFLRDLASAEATGGTQAFVVDGTGRLVAHPTRNPASGDNNLSRLPQVAAAMAATDATGTTSGAISEADGSPAFAAFAKIPQLGWSAVAETPAAEALAPFHALLWQSALVLAMGLLVAAATGISLATRVTAPISKLQAGAERLGQGDLTQRVNIRNRDELGVFADTFNTMASRLQQSQRGLEAKADERAHGLDVALQQQTLTAGVMKAIGRSDQNLETVLETLVTSAVQLCEAEHGAIWLKQDKVLKLSAQAGYPGEWVTPARDAALAISMDADTPHGLAAWLGQPVAVEDMIGDHRFESGVAPGYAGGKAGLAVPLMRDGNVEGVIWLSHLMAIPFTDGQGELLHGFADQAVVAIENARLVGDLKARDQLIGALHREQTDVADIVRQAAQAPGDAQLILERSVEAASRLLGAECVYVSLQDGQGLKVKAAVGLPVNAADQMDGDTGNASAAAQAVTSGAAVEISDAGDETATFLLPGAQSGIAVPLIKDGIAIGAISVERASAGTLPPRHVQLLKALADHAVVVLGTMSVWNDLHTRNAELATALDRQDASDSLSRAIASPAFDLAGVCDALGRSIATLCRASDVQTFRQRGNVYRAVTGDQQFAPGRGSIVGRVASDGSVHQIADVSEDGEYQVVEDAPCSVLGLPLRSDGELVGALTLSRAGVEPFSDDEMSVALAFAEFAAIAIEKANLLERAQHRANEIADALHEKAASAEMLKLVGRKSVDQETLLEVLAATAAEACAAAKVFVLETSGENHRVAAGYGLSYDDRADDRPLPDWMTAALTETLAAGGPVEHALTWPGPAEDDASTEERRLLVAPVQRDGAYLGAFMLERASSQPFSAGQIQLAESLADQAAVAMANIRLRGKLDATERERDSSLARNSTAARLAGILGHAVPDTQPVFDTIVGAVTLCGADVATLAVLEDGHHRPVASTSKDAALHADIAETLASEGDLVHIADLAAEPERAQALAGQGFGAVLGIPVQLDGLPSGFLLLLRRDAGAFSDRHIEFAGALADQAAVAVENERLFRDLNTRTAELSESLEREIATAATAEAINRHNLALEAVLPGMAAASRRLAGADTSAIYLLDGDVYRLAAETGMADDVRAFELDNPHTASGDSWIGRAALDKAVIHVPDRSVEPETHRLPTQGPADGEAMLFVPLQRAGIVIGVFALTRQQAGGFAAQPIELVRTFADLAVVAMENISLTGEVRGLNAELGMAREEQQTTADASRIISGSAFDLMSLIQTLTGSAMRLCAAKSVRLYLGDGGGRYQIAALSGVTPDERSFDAANPPSTNDGTWIGAALRDRAIVHVHDALEHQPDDLQRYGHAGSVICVPLGTQNSVLGAVLVTRDAAGGFGQHQVELVKALADQVVLAIEHTRLLADAQKRTDELAILLEDLRAARTRLSETERLASVGQFTAGIMNEIRDPLTFVKHFADQSYDNINKIRRTLESAVLDVTTRGDVEDLADTLADSIKAVAEHSMRTDSIIGNMLLHARGETGENRLADINAVLDESLALAYQGARAQSQTFNIALEKDFDPEAGHVDLYPHEMTRVFLNLIANGIYATEQRSASEIGSGYQPALSAATRNLGDAVEIRIRDNGTGITSGVLERMFDPFFSTKPASEASGLGLSLSRDIIVNQHAGSIEVDTRRGAYTEFRIVLPREGASLAMRADMAALGASVPGGTGQVESAQEVVAEDVASDTSMDAPSDDQFLDDDFADAMLPDEYYPEASSGDDAESDHATERNVMHEDAI